MNASVIAGVTCLAGGCIAALYRSAAIGYRKSQLRVTAAAVIAAMLLPIPSTAVTCDLCLMEVGQKVRINADQYGVMIYCRTLQQAIDWEVVDGGDGSMCRDRKMIGHVFQIVAKRILWRDHCSLAPSICKYAVYTISDGTRTAYTLDGGGDVFANGKWGGPF